MVDPFCTLDIVKPTYAASFQSSAVNFDTNYKTLMTLVSANASSFLTQNDILLFVFCYGATGTLAFTYFDSPDGTTWTATTQVRSKLAHNQGADTYGTLFQYMGNQPYFRITMTPTSFAAAAPLVYGTVYGNKRSTNNIA